MAELYRRWSERHPAATPTPQLAAREASPAAAASAGGTIFISYSRTDIGAAKKLFTALQDIGGDVAWFDKSALRAGDDWEQHILGAIQRCSLFLPLLSASTEQRTEGYFRREWDEAAERFFNGRRQESAELRRLVLQAPLTVLFGKSGLGKTPSFRRGCFAASKRARVAGLRSA